MENKNQSVVAEQENEMQLTDMVKICWGYFLRFWKWFVLSVVVCVALGFVYLQRQTRVYQSQAVMLIEDADPSGSMGIGRRNNGAMNALLELNGISAGNNLKNEIFILGSHRLLRNVVDSLGLDVDYSTPVSLHKVSLYKSTPIVAEFGVAIPTNVNFEVKLLDENNYEISDLKVLYEGAKEPTEVEGVFAGKFGEQLATPVGDICLQKQANYAKFTAGENDEFEQKQIFISRVSKYAATERVRGSVGVSEFDKMASLVVLNCSDNNVARANEILSEIFNAYKRDVVEYKNRVAQNTAEFIDSRIALISSELSDVEGRYEQFMEKNKFVNLEQNASVFLNETSQARKLTLELETQLAVAGYLADYMNQHAENDKTIPVLSGIGADGAAITSQVNEYNKLVMERMRVAENASENSPRLKDFDRRIEALRPTITASIDSYVSSIKLQLKDARKNERSISGQISNMPAQQREALTIVRQQELKNALYTYLLNKREEVALQLAINEANVRLVENPMSSGVPISPKTNIILFISFVLGIVIPAGIIFLIDMFDTKLKYRADIEKVCTAPVVAEIPVWENHSDSETIANLDHNRPVVEAFRLLRYGLNFMKSNARTMVVTSSTPGQGKTFVSKNIAVVLGMAGKKVLLVDADIRKCTLSKSLAPKVKQGLTHYLLEEGETLTKYIVKESVHENVDFLPGGVIPPNPAELLMSSRLEELVQEAKKDYDYVIIDTTPMLAVADASIVGRIADLTLFVLRARVEERSFLPVLQRMYVERKLRNLCLILNDVEIKRGQGYGKGYGYGHGYGYGYGLEAEKKKKGFFNRKS